MMRRPDGLGYVARPDYLTVAPVLRCRGRGDVAMPIRYQCACGHPIITPEERAGKLEECPSCRMSVLAPDAPVPHPKQDEGGSLHPGPTWVSWA
jgi:hypothetical protein